jgi:orotate phosphoribosyltransferase
MSALAPWKHRFISLMVAEGVLRFGDFTLKSGRRSPFFFNLGAVSKGSAMKAMGEAYAEAYRFANLKCDVLFGPAYKGIPIATSMAIALASLPDPVDMPVCYNRKEAKSHGEGGHLIGATLHGRVLIVDDVVTDGAAKIESKEIIERAGAQAHGVLIALDRQEFLDGRRLTAAQALEVDHGLRVTSIVNLQDVIDYLGAPESGIARSDALLDSIVAYQKIHCVK